jgi:hypothetical protein
MLCSTRARVRPHFAQERNPSDADTAFTLALSVVRKREQPSCAVRENIPHAHGR